MKSWLMTASIVIGAFSISSAEPEWEVTNPIPLPGEIVSIDIPARDTIWAANDAAMLVRSVDNGESWEIIDFPRVVEGKLLIDFTSGLKGYALATADPSTPFGAVAFRTENGGADWTTWEIGDQGDPFGATALAVFGETALVGGIVPGVTDQAVVYRLVNNSWTISYLPGDAVRTLHGLALFNQNLGWAVGDDGYLAATTDAGRTWQRIPTQLQTDLYCVQYNSPTTGWIGGGNFNSSHLYKTTSGGASWQEIGGLPASSKFIGLQSYQGSGVAAISRGGGDPDVAHLLLSTDGRNWSAIASLDRQLLSTVRSNATTVWVAGAEGFLARSTAGEALEQISRRVTTRNLVDISFASGAVGWAVGELGNVLKSFDGGRSWQRIASFPILEPIAVQAFSPWRAIVACRGSREMLTSNGGETWREVSVADGNVTDFEMFRERIYGVSGSRVSFSTDVGAHWTSTAVRPGGTILSVAAASDLVAYAAILRDTAFVTEDGGASWQPSLVVPANTRALCFIDSNISRAAVETEAGTSVWATTDHWRHRERIHSLGFDAIGMKYFSETEGYILGERGEFRLLQRGAVGGQPSGLRTATIIRRIELFERWLWVCGEGGFIGRWGENWLGVPQKEADVQPENLRLMTFWPNPTNGRISFRYHSHRPATFSLFSADGRRVMNFDYPQSRGPVSLDLTGLQSGLYFVRDRDALLVPEPILLVK